MEIGNDFTNMNQNRPILVAILFLISGFFYCLLPLIVLVRECIESVRSTAKNDSHQLLYETNQLRSQESGHIALGLKKRHGSKISRRGSNESIDTHNLSDKLDETSLVGNNYSSNASFNSKDKNMILDNYDTESGIAMRGMRMDDTIRSNGKRLTQIASPGHLASLDMLYGDDSSPLFDSHPHENRKNSVLRVSPSPNQRQGSYDGSYESRDNEPHFHSALDRLLNASPESENKDDELTIVSTLSVPPAEIMDDFINAKHGRRATLANANGSPPSNTNNDSDFVRRNTQYTTGKKHRRTHSLDCIANNDKSLPRFVSSDALLPPRSPNLPPNESAYGAFSPTRGSITPREIELESTTGTENMVRVRKPNTRRSLAMVV